MAHPPIELNLSLEDEVFVKDIDECYYLVLDIGEEVVNLEDVSMSCGVIQFVADGIPHTYELDESVVFLEDKEEVYLQIKNRVVDELFKEIEGPVREIKKED